MKESMKLTAVSGQIIVKEKSVTIISKVKDLKNTFKELFRIIPKHTKIVDCKRILTNRLTQM